MTLSVRRTLSDGTIRAFTRNGVILMLVYAIASLLQGGFVWVLTTTYIPMVVAGTTPGVAPPAGSALPLRVSLQAALLSVVTGGLITLPVTLVGVRTLAATNSDQITDELVLYRLGWATLNMLLASFLKLILLVVVEFACLLVVLFAAITVAPQTVLTLTGTTTGQLLLVGGFFLVSLPAIFIDLSFRFIAQEIALYDRNFVAALRNSWRIARGNRLRILALIVIPMGLQLLLSVLIHPFFPDSIASLQFLLLEATLSIESSVVAIVVLGIITSAYLELTADSADQTNFGWVNA